MSRNGKKESAELDTSALPSLPPGWCWTTVDEIGEVRLGRQRSPKNRSDKYPTQYVRAANITWRGLSLDDVMDMDFRPSERAVYALQPGDILLSEASGSADEVGKPAIWNGEIAECCFQNTVIRFRPHNLPPDYPFVVFCHFARNKVFAHVAKGIGIHHLGADRFGQMPFPLPPVAEQVRIKAKVDELFSDLDAGVAALERVRANLKRYRAAVLKAAVEGRLTADWRAKNPPKETGPQLLARILRERRRKWEEEQLASFAKAGKTPPAKWKEKYKEPAGPDCTGVPALPEGWCWATVDQLLYGIEAGKSFECLPRPASLDEWAVIKVSAMTWGEFLEEENKAIPPQARFDPAAEVCPGDVLLSRSNTVELVGATVLVRKCRPRLLLSDKSMRLLVNSTIDRVWFQKAMSSRTVRRQLSAMATGTSDSMRNVSQEKVLSVLVPLPPIVEQGTVVAEIDRRLSVSDEAEAYLDASIRRSVRLRQAILTRAFEGRLVAQDPSDEPATTLLERIKAENTGTNGRAKPRKTR